MVFDIFVSNMLMDRMKKKNRKSKEKLMNDMIFKGMDESSKELVDDVNKNKEFYTTSLINIVQIIIFIGSLVLFYKCYKLKQRFDIVEFLGSLCYPLLYIGYRVFITPVSTESCKRLDNGGASCIAPYEETMGVTMGETMGETMKKR